MLKNSPPGLLSTRVYSLGLRSCDRGAEPHTKQARVCLLQCLQGHPNATVGTPPMQRGGHLGFFFQGGSSVSTIPVKKYKDRRSDQMVET